MKRFFKVLLGLGILAAGFAVTGLLWITRPEASKKETAEVLPVVKVMAVDLRPLVIDIPSQGIVESNRRSQLASELSGRVVEINSNFEVGNSVAEGELLVQLDPVNFKAAVAQAEAALADAKSELASEIARAEQARRDWGNINRNQSGEASELMLRIPQKQSAEAKVASAEASLQKALQDLKRTEIVAPYSSIVASKQTELGSYLTPGSPIGEVFEHDNYEVRLPVSVNELAFLKTNNDGIPDGNAKISAKVAGITHEWEAVVSRTEGEINRQTRSLYLIATITKPENEEGVTIRPGLFVEGHVSGREIPDIAIVPFSAFTDLDSVVVVDKQNRLEFREVEVLYRKGDDVYISSGLKQNDRVCITEVPDVVEGLPVSPELVQPPRLDGDLETSTASNQQ